ncbi:MAG: hypothetical protein QXU20_04560 [Candidatus Woesearchaeota archaeon]
MKIKKNLKRNLGFLILLSIAFLFLFFPPLIRILFYKGFPAGTTNYGDIIVASKLKFNNEFLETEKTKTISPYYLFLNFSLKFINQNILMNFLPPVFGVLFILLFYFLLKRIRVEKEVLFFATLILILSSSFIYNFTTLNENIFIMVFIALGLLLFVSDNKIISVFGLLILIIISVGNLISSIVTYILLIMLITQRSLIFAYKSEKRKRAFFIITILFLMISIINFYSSKNNFFNGYGQILLYFSEVKMSDGFSIILIILSLIGLFNLGSEKKLLKNSFMASIILLIIFGSNFIVYANVIICIAASYGFLWITNRNWELKNLELWSIMLIICGIFFIAISVDLRIANQRPNLDDIEALNFLKDFDRGVVLSHQDYGFWLEQISKKDSFVNNLNEIYVEDQLKKLFQSTNLSFSLEMIDKNKIRYVFITPDMKSGLVWNKDDEGLLFIIKNNVRFKNVYNKNNYEIWEVLNE